jgi:hypothetical protein
MHLSPTLRAEHAAVLTFGTVDFTLPAASPTSPTSPGNAMGPSLIRSARASLAADTLGLSGPATVHSFGSRTRALGQSVRVIVWRHGTPAFAFTDDEAHYSFEQPYMGLLEGASAASTLNTSGAWGWHDGHLANAAFDGKLGPYTRRGNVSAAANNSSSTTNQFFAGSMATILPGDELTIECTYEASIPFAVRGGFAQSSEMCLGFLMYSPAGAFSQSVLLVPSVEPPPLLST